MLKLRTGLIIAALLLCGCDHHKKANQAQAEAGTAAVGQSDSELTGEPTTTNPSPYPRALPVTETNAPSAASVSVASGTPAASPTESTTQPTDTNTPAPPPDSTPSTTVASSPPPAANSSTPPPAGTTSSAMPPAASSSDSGSDVAPRLTLNTPNPVAAATPAPAAIAEEQVIVIDTTQGRIVIETDDSAAPKTSENFRKLAADGFYNHTIFHRIIPHFIIQGGDPNSLSEDRSLQGKGGPGYTIPAEISLKHVRGAVAMARLPDSVNPNRDSNGSQFYICVVDSPSLDDQYTVFGHVIKGMDVVDAISNLARDKNDNPLNRVEMEVTLEPKEQALSEGSAAGP